MFLELIALGVFIATAFMNSVPVNGRIPERDSVTEIRHTPEDWTQASTQDGTVFYVNSRDVQKTGSRVKMWSLADYTVAQINGDSVYLSRKTQDEYDCKEGWVRLLYTSLYSESMGAGEPIYSHAETYAWEPVMLDSEAAVMWKRACDDKPG